MPRSREEDMERIRELLAKMGPELEAAAGKLDPEFASDAKVSDSASEPSVVEVTDSADDEIMDKIRALIESGNSRISEAANKFEPEVADIIASEPVAANKFGPEVTDLTEPEPDAADTTEPEPASDKKAGGAEFSAVVHEAGEDGQTRARAARKLLNKRSRLLIAGLAALLVLITILGLLLLKTRTVTINFKSFDVEVETEYDTRARTVGGLIEDAISDEGLVKRGAALCEMDIVSPDPSTPVTDGLEILVRHPEERTANIRGEKRSILLVPGTVRENLDLNGISYNEAEDISPGLDEKVGSQTTIVIK